MGYCTCYDFLVDIRKSDPDTIQRLEDAVSKMEISPNIYVSKNYITFGAYGKWYSCDDDMLALSRLFPEFLFELHGEGDSADDLWISYYQDGKMQTCFGKIIYEEYDPDKMEVPKRNTAINSESIQTESKKN